MKKTILAAAIVSAVCCAVPTLAETASERGACEGDAFRVCWSAIPDPHSVFVCLARNHSRLSAACREVIARYSPPHSRSDKWAIELRNRPNYSSQDP